MVRDEVEGLAVRYYDQTGDAYSPQEASYAVLPEDIVKNLTEPTVVPRGSRIYYDFCDI